MLQFAFVVLVFAALIAAVFGQKAAQGFVRFVVGAVVLLLGAFLYLFWRLDEATKVPTQVAAPLAAQPAVPLAAPAATPTAARWVACPTCGGSGRVPCSFCHGTGSYSRPTVPTVDASGMPGPVDLGGPPDPCPFCGHTGLVMCQACKGAGGWSQP